MKSGKQLKVKVIREDVRNARRNAVSDKSTVSHCIVANAIKRVLPEGWEIHMMGFTGATLYNKTNKSFVEVEISGPSRCHIIKINDTYRHTKSAQFMWEKIRKLDRNLTITVVHGNHVFTS